MQEKCNIDTEVLKININDNVQETKLISLKSSQNLNLPFESAEKNQIKKLKKRKTENSNKQKTIAARKTLKINETNEKILNIFIKQTIEKEKLIDNKKNCKGNRNREFN